MFIGRLKELVFHEKEIAPLFVGKNQESGQLTQTSSCRKSSLIPSIMSFIDIVSSKQDRLQAYPAGAFKFNKLV